MNKPKYLVYETRLLTKPREGVYTITTYYSDGSEETREAPLGPIINPPRLDSMSLRYDQPFWDTDQGRDNALDSHNANRETAVVVLVALVTVSVLVGLIALSKALLY